MRIPALAFGLSREVKARGRKLARAILAGATWDEALGEPLLDTATQPGLILLSSPDEVVDATPHYHVYLPLDIAAEKLLEDAKTGPLEQTLFERALSTAWGTLAIMAPNTLWLLEEDRCRQLVAAAVEHWDELIAEGDRYANRAGAGRALWDASSNLRYALARIGLPKDWLTRPLPPHGVPELVQQLKLLG